MAVLCQDSNPQAKLRQTQGYESQIKNFLDPSQQARLKAWITETLPRSAGQIGAFIAREFGIEYQAKSGIIALLHRLGMEYRRPKAIARKLDPAKQAAFIKAYENLLNQMGDDEAVLFGDAVHPVHGAQAVGCWAPKEANIAVPQTTRRQGLNIHGALDLETGKTMMVEALSVDAASTIRLLIAIQAMYPGKRLIHLFWTMPATTMRIWCNTGWRSQAAASGCTSSPATAHI
jgi:hypothetical protein